MTIIEKVKQILMGFSRISDVCNDIHIDFSDDTPTSYGLSSTGDTLISEDILGNQRRQHNFVLYAVFQSLNDYDRMCNSNALLELAQWLESQTDSEIIKITASNGMVYAIPNDNTQDAVQYQLQISVIYKKESEE